jgi:hypothetical protein
LSSSEQKRQEMRRKILEQLHHVDINPHVIAMRWLSQYRRAWWVIFVDGGRRLLLPRAGN